MDDHKKETLVDFVLELIEIFVNLTQFLGTYNNEALRNCYYKNLDEIGKLGKNPTKNKLLDTYFNIILMTGGSPIDVNKEYECLKENKMIYVLMEINIDQNSDNLTYFRNSNKQFKEICMFEECDDFLKSVYICNTINSSYKFCEIEQYIIEALRYNYEYFIDYKFLSIVNLIDGKKNYLNEHYDNIYINDNKTLTNETDNNTNNYFTDNMYDKDLHVNYKYFNLIYSFILVIFLLRFIISIIYQYKSKQSNYLINNKVNNNNTISEKTEEDSESNEDSDDSSDSEKEKNLIIKKSSKKKLQNKIFAYKKINLDSPKFNFLNCLDLSKNFENLNGLENEVFNETNLIEISGFRLIFCYLIIVNDLVYNEIKGNLFGNKTIRLIKSNFFFLFKLTQYALEGYKIICGIIVGYKLLSYLYKNKDKNLLKNFFKFFLKSFQYILNFLFIHFCVECFFLQIGYNFTELEVYKFLYKKIYSVRKCIKSPITIFIPFYLNYHYSENNSFQKNTCSIPVLFSLSEFYCLIFLMIIAYSFCVLKNKIIEIIFFIYNFCLIISIYFIKLGKVTLFEENTNKLNITNFFQFNETSTTPHLFFPLYYFGFNIGIILFYYNSYSIIKTDKLPFKINYKMMFILSKINDFVKKFLEFFLFCLIILLSCIFQIVIHDSIKDSYNFKKPLIFKGNKTILKFIYYYETQIFGILFCLFLCLFLTNNFEDNVIRKIIRNNFFISFNRVSFIFYNLSNVLIEIYCGLNKTYLSGILDQFFLISLTLFTIILIISDMLMLFIFMPVRYLSKLI